MKESNAFDTESSVLKKMKKRDKHGFWLDFFKNPSPFFENNPKYSPVIGLILVILLFSILALVSFLEPVSVSAFAPVSFSFETAAQYLEILVTVFLAVLFLPLIYFEEKRRKKIDFVEERIPGFLRDLSALVENGLTVQEALRDLSNPPNNFFLKEIQLMGFKMRSGIPFEKCLDDFGKRYHSKLIRRAASVIDIAEKSGGQMSLSVSSAAFDLQEFVNAQKERASRQNTYGAILFLSFFIFLGVSILLIRQFNSMYSAAESSSIFGSPESVSDMSVLICRLLLIQAFFLGLTAGKFKTGVMVTGLKYTVLLMVVVCVSFAAGTNVFR
ncbi:type II secretion system F family protein [Methanolapillus millepedarum]|uniref:Type II secretion system protein GspF domain-containing protein n=1 Tax=Methanolapillus millepedarum TaxID=3028296 RepID=A0AA96V3P4_9EURY|nr:hypothetical protein MsAc7_04140 [Methanosarcinaceae archaeon Ac7]